MLAIEPVSLDLPIGDGDRGQLADLVVDAGDALPLEQVGLLMLTRRRDVARRPLCPRAACPADALRARGRPSAPLEEIGNALGVTRSGPPDRVEGSGADPADEGYAELAGLPRLNSSLDGPLTAGEGGQRRAIQRVVRTADPLVSPVSAVSRSDRRVPLRSTRITSWWISAANAWS